MIHTHTSACRHITAVVTYRLKSDGRERVWNLAASCADTEETIKAHFAKHVGNAGEFISVTFESH